MPRWIARFSDGTLEADAVFVLQLEIQVDKGRAALLVLSAYAEPQGVDRELQDGINLDFTRHLDDLEKALEKATDKAESVQLVAADACTLGHTRPGGKFEVTPEQGR